MTPHKTRMDVSSRLLVFRNVCERQWKTQAELTESKMGLPYLKVGRNNRVHIVLFPHKHEVGLYFKMPNSIYQTYKSYPMDRTRGGKWMSDEFITQITMIAAAINHALEKRSSNS